MCSRPFPLLPPPHRSKEKFVHPNVRGGWNVRAGMTLVTAGALYFGTRETYIIATAVAIWREGYDCIELLWFKRDGSVHVLRAVPPAFGSGGV